MKKAIGFYWTLPVPWARFTTLPEDIDAAATASRTIRYQREVIRRFATENHLALVAEKTFLEISPDRSSKHVFDALNGVKALCLAEDATLLHVDFASVQGWRSMAPLADWADKHGIRVETVFPGEVLIDGQMFDPHAHFSDWRARQREWSEGKADRVAAARAAIQRLSVDALSNREIAEILNARDIRSATGKPWTAETVRKLRPQKTH